jgi:transcriptional regulator with XRE-family HTH domain
MLEMIPDRADEGREAIATAIRQVLDAIGQRLAAARAGEAGELERLASFLQIAEELGLRQHEIAERAGVSRQTLSNLRSSDRGLAHRLPLDTQLMVALARHRDHDDLLGVYGRPPVGPHEVEEALKRLTDAGVIRIAGLIPKGESTIAVYRLTALGIAELPRRLYSGSLPPALNWTAYVACPESEAGLIATRGEQALGQEQVVVIPAGTAHGMELPEVAFKVEAPANDFNAAVIAASHRYRELRLNAGLGEVADPVRLNALIPPDVRRSS